MLLQSAEHPQQLRSGSILSVLYGVDRCRTLEVRL